MSDYFEIDFYQITGKKSADAIPLRYKINQNTYKHIVDAGFQTTGTELVNYINTFYSNPSTINNVVVTHSDADHCGGIKEIIDKYTVNSLWMLRPWLYTSEIIDRSTRFGSVENLIKRLKEIYPTIAELETIAIEKGIEIKEPFQGSSIGEFRVLAPSKARYLDLVVESDKTPESVTENQSASLNLQTFLEGALRNATNFIKSLWGEETFSEEDTTSENEMSVIQFASLCNVKILLTGDAGRSALEEAANYAPYIGLQLPGIDRFQIPHHGSRRNVSSDLLNKWLGPKLLSAVTDDESKFQAYISAAKDDPDHPRKSVIRAVIHRGGKVYTNKNSSLRTAQNAPDRAGWTAAQTLPYPEDQEE